MDFPSAAGRRRLATAIKERRAELDLSQQDIAASGGPSVATQFQLESAAEKSYSDTTVKRLERALQWTPGSVLAIIAGRDPEVLANGSGEPATPDGSAAQPDQDRWVSTMIVGDAIVEIRFEKESQMTAREKVEKMAAVALAVTEALERVDSEEAARQADPGSP